jgi:hypothetical protein
MEAEWSADRANLRLALRDHPEWSVPELAQRLGRSVTWIKIPLLQVAMQATAA